MPSIAVTRVCPECGELAGTQPFCAACAKNLIHVERLPSREEWEARRPRNVGVRAPADAAALGRPLVRPRDNRGASDDSRFWAPVPRAYIVGRVLR
jgi:hypothetical protein